MAHFFPSFIIRIAWIVLSISFTIVSPRFLTSSTAESWSTATEAATGRQRRSRTGPAVPIYSRQGYILYFSLKLMFPCAHWFYLTLREATKKLYFLVAGTLRGGGEKDIQYEIFFSSNFLYKRQINVLFAEHWVASFGRVDSNRILHLFFFSNVDIHIPLMK